MPFYRLYSPGLRENWRIVDRVSDSRDYTIGRADEGTVVPVRREHGLERILVSRKAPPGAILEADLSEVHQVYEDRIRAMDSIDTPTRGPRVINQRGPGNLRASEPAVEFHNGSREATEPK